MSPCVRARTHRCVCVGRGRGLRGGGRLGIEREGDFSTGVHPDPGGAARGVNVLDCAPPGPGQHLSPGVEF